MLNAADLNTDLFSVYLKTLEYILNFLRLESLKGDNNPMISMFYQEELYEP